MLILCWASVTDGGPTLSQHWPSQIYVTVRSCCFICMVFMYWLSHLFHVSFRLASRPKLGFYFISNVYHLFNKYKPWLLHWVSFLSYQKYVSYDVLRFARKKHIYWPFHAWIYYCYLHPLQAANCCRNSRLVVDEDNLKWVANEKNAIIKTVPWKWCIVHASQGSNPV